MVLTSAVVIEVAGQQPSPKDGQGWTGVTNPEDVIAARQALMAEMERLMEPIDSFTVGEPEDPEELASAAATIAQMLLATPHLFPPTTDLYDPAAETPPTIALPAIWQNFSTFYTLANAAAASAKSLAGAKSPDALRAGGTALRASCDACHAPFLRAYQPSKPSEEDASFDFDKVFGGDDAPKP
jgi:cytochrome c556